MKINTELLLQVRKERELKELPPFAEGMSRHFASELKKLNNDLYYVKNCLKDFQNSIDWYKAKIADLELNNPKDYEIGEFKRRLRIAQRNLTEWSTSEKNIAEKIETAKKEKDVWDDVAQNRNVPMLPPYGIHNVWTDANRWHERYSYKHEFDHLNDAQIAFITIQELPSTTHTNTSSYSSYTPWPSRYFPYGNSQDTPSCFRYMTIDEREAYCNGEEDEDE